MGIYIYVLALIVFGVFISYQFGRATKKKTGCGIALFLSILSVLMGVLLSVGGAYLSEVICLLGSNFCIATDDHTVWTFLYPIIFSPLYLIAMYVPNEK